MWELTKELRFEAAHKLAHHDGKCARLHGHSWVARIIVRVGVLHESGPQTNMGLDYALIKDAYSTIRDQYLDHHYLNETLGTDSPTSEYVAQWLFDALAPKFRSVLHFVGLVAVEVDETCTSSCRYTREAL